MTQGTKIKIFSTSSVGSGDQLIHFLNEDPLRKIDIVGFEGALASLLQGQPNHEQLLRRLEINAFNKSGQFCEVPPPIEGVGPAETIAFWSSLVVILCGLWQIAKSIRRKLSIG